MTLQVFILEVKLNTSVVNPVGKCRAQASQHVASAPLFLSVCLPSYFYLFIIFLQHFIL